MNKYANNVVYTCGKLQYEYTTAGGIIMPTSVVVVSY